MTRRDAWIAGGVAGGVAALLVAVVLVAAWSRRSDGPSESPLPEWFGLGERIRSENDEEPAADAAPSTGDSLTLRSDTTATDTTSSAPEDTSPIAPPWDPEEQPRRAEESLAEITISGRVIEAGTRRPIAAALVTAVPSSAGPGSVTPSDLTNSNGVFQILDVSAGAAHRLDVAAEGFMPISVFVPAGPAGDRPVLYVGDLELQPE